MNGVPVNRQLQDLEELYAKYAPEIFRFALRLCGNRDDAEDLTAEAFAQAAGRMSSYRGEASPKTWLCGIVLNQGRMLARKRRARRDEVECNLAVAKTISHDGLAIAQAINGLPEPQRVAFLLVKGEGFTHAEAAQAMRLPVGTVYFRVHQAVKRLRASLASLGTPDRHMAEVSFEQDL